MKILREDKKLNVKLYGLLKSNSKVRVELLTIKHHEGFFQTGEKFNNTNTTLLSQK